MENAINFVRGEAEKHFSNSINRRLFCAVLYHTSQKYYSGAGWRAFEKEAFKPLLAAADEGETLRDQLIAGEETLKLSYLN